MKNILFENEGDYSISSFVCEEVTFIFRKVFFFLHSSESFASKQ